MKELRELLTLIEKARMELDYSLEKQEDYEKFYQKSIRLDRLIEEYIDLTQTEALPRIS